MDAPKIPRIQPPETEVSRPFWEGCIAGELRLQYCRSCARYQFYPRIICSHCGAGEPEWRAASGAGHIASFSVVRRGISRAYPAPYVVALIDLDEGPRMMSSIVDASPESVTVGAAVDVKFENWGAEHVLPVFSLRESHDHEQS
jgi:uncharacterized OB-fold protein